MWNRYLPDPFVGAAHAVSTTLTPTVVTSSAVNSPVATSPPARRIAVRGKIHWEYMVPINASVRPDQLKHHGRRAKQASP